MDIFKRETDELISNWDLRIGDYTLQSYTPMSIYISKKKEGSRFPDGEGGAFDSETIIKYLDLLWKENF